MVYEFELPSKILIGNKKFCLNLNKYRNAHHMLLNAVKQAFFPYAVPDEKFKAEKIKVSYRIEKKSRGRFDTMNVYAVVDKFFLDWLVEWGYIEDDDCTRVICGGAEGINGAERDKITAFVEIIK